MASSEPRRGRVSFSGDADGEPRMSHRVSERGEAAWLRDPATEVLSGGKLHVSSGPSSRKAIITLGITHVVNLSAEENGAIEEDDTKLLNVKMGDSEETLTDEVLKRVFAFVDAAVKEEDSHVLLHCAEGVSRSPTLAAAYLVHAKGLSVDAAMKQIKEKRGIADFSMYRRALTRLLRQGKAKKGPEALQNSAFVFLKPLAVTDNMKELVKKTFEAKSIRVVKEGQIDAAVIDKKQLIDKHYYAIASKATLLTPDKLNVPADKFKEQFGLEWADVLKDGKALNAKDACEKLDVDADGLNDMWGAAKKSKNLVKLGGGFYCAKLEKDGKGPFYVFNGFFMTMRAGFVKPDTCIYYYLVEWDSKDLAWADFRGKVLGPTDPADAPKDSLRGGAFADWKGLGLPSEPNTGENCCHASASPFEGLCERMNWLGYKADRDPWGKALLSAGVRPKTIKDWSLDPVVSYGSTLAPTTKSIWDTLEDMDAQACIDKCGEIDEWRPLRKAKFGKVGRIKPEQKGLNFYVKCVKGPETVEGTDAKEVFCGDETGSVVLSIRSDAQAALCKPGALLRVQNTHVRIFKGYIRLVVDKWSALKAAEAGSCEIGEVDEKKNASAVEYELQ